MWLVDSLLPVSAFPKKKGSGFTYPYCKACSRGAKRPHRVGRNTYKNKTSKKRTAARNKAKDLIGDVLTTSACADCGETDPLVLEFDHRDPTKKRASISSMLNRGEEIGVIETELQKCDVVCSNCHRKRTYRQQDSWRLTLVK